MAEYSFPFDAEWADGIPDREYPASFFARYLQALVTSGVMKGYGENLNVTTDGVTMKSVIGSGVAFVEGRHYHNTDVVTHTHDTEIVGQDRIDRVVIRLDLRLEGRYIKTFVKKGSPSLSPVPPELQQDIDIYELSLAQVKIKGGQGYIDGIIDERGNDFVCPWVGSKILPNFDDQALADLVNEVENLTPQKIGAMPITGGDFTGPITVNGKPVGVDDIDAYTGQRIFYINPIDGRSDGDGLTRQTAVDSAYALIDRNILKPINYGERVIVVTTPGSQGGYAALDYIFSRKFIGGKIQLEANFHELWSPELDFHKANLGIIQANFRSYLHVHSTSYIEFYDCTFDYTGNNYSQGFLIADQGTVMAFISSTFIKPASTLFECRDGSIMIISYCNIDTSPNNRTYNATSATIFIDNNKINGTTPLESKYGGGQIFK